MNNTPYPIEVYLSKYTIEWLGPNQYLVRENLGEAHIYNTSLRLVKKWIQSCDLRGALA